MANVTISDIARQAGVSISTVSRVLNEAPDVSERTRKKILELIESSGYTPSLTARALSRQTSDIIGVVIPEIDNHFFGQMLKGIATSLDNYNLTMICFNTDNDPEKDISSLEMLNNYRVRGIIYTPAVDYTKNVKKTRLKKALLQLNLPIVQADRLAGCFDSDSVLFNDNETIYRATRHLIEAGHKKIGIINAKLDFYHANIRQQGFLRAMEEAGLEVLDKYLFFGDYYLPKAYELAKEMLAMPDRPSAIITCNNNSSRGLLKAVAESGERIPEDIDFIGLDKIPDLAMMGLYNNYIERDSYLMGVQAVELLIKRLAFPEQNYHTIYLDAPLRLSRGSDDIKADPA